MFQRLTQSGASIVHTALTEYRRSSATKGVWHDTWTRTYKNDDVRDWLFQQKKGK